MPSRFRRYDRDPENYRRNRTKAGVESEIPGGGDAKHNIVLGVDLDIKQIAVTSTGMFWKGGYLNHRRQEYKQVRGKLLQTGTESAHRTIEQMGDRETRWVKDYLHRISKPSSKRR